MSNRRHVQSAGLIFWQDQQCALLASNSHGSQKSIPIHKTGIKTLIEKSIFKTAQRYVSKQTKHLATYACNYYNIFAYIIYVYAHFFFPINVFHNHIFFLITWKLWNNRCLKGRTWKNSGLTGNNIIAHIPGFARQMVSNKITTQNTSVNGIQLRMSTKTWINITARLVFPDKIHCGLFDSIKTLETAKFRNNRQFSYRFQPVPIQNRRIHPTPTCLKNLEHWGKSGNHSWNQVGP